MQNILKYNITELDLITNGISTLSD